MLHCHIGRNTDMPKIPNTQSLIATGIIILISPLKKNILQQQQQQKKEKSPKGKSQIMTLDLYHTRRLYCQYSKT